MRLFTVKRKGALAIVAKSAVERPVFLMKFDLVDTVAAWFMILGVIMAGATGVPVSDRTRTYQWVCEDTVSLLTVREDFGRVLSVPERIQQSLEDRFHPSCRELR